MLADVDQRLFGSENPVSIRQQAVEPLFSYFEQHIANGGRFNHISRHILGLFNGQPGARRWRRILSEEGCREGANIEVLQKALDAVSN